MEATEKVLVDMNELKATMADTFTEAIKANAKGESHMQHDITVKMVKDEIENKMEDKKGGFKSFGHFAMDVVRASGPGGEMSKELKEWQAVQKLAGFMEEGSGPQGGFTVPVEFSNAVREKSIEGSIVRPRASYQPMASNRIELPADVDYNHQTNYFGGVCIYRPGELGAKTPTNPTFEKICLTLHKVAGLCYVSDELLADSTIGMEAYLSRKFGAAIGFLEDHDFLVGTGANMPLGVANAANPSLIPVPAEALQPITTIVAENIINMWSRLYPAGQSNAVWIANINTFPQLAQMAIGVGLGGVPVWMPAGGLSGQPFQTLMGRPLIYTEKLPTLGAQGDIILADLTQYLIGDKGGLQTASSIHFMFDHDETAFRFVLRYDGTPTWTSALQPHVGATLSPFVCIVARV